MIYTTSSGRRIPLAPPEGWLTLGLVLLLCLSFAWSLDDALLVLGQDEYTDFLTWTAVGGVLAGFIGPMVGWGRWRTYAIGSTFAALLTPLLVGWVLIPEGASPHALFVRSAEAGVGAWQDLVIRNALTTPQIGHHLLLLGIIVWGSSMFASYAAFGHRRPLNAVVLIGLLLIGNMALTARDQLAFIVLYSLASLFLLIRFHTFDEQADWIRRRIGDPSAISGLYLRGGTIFIVVAVLGSLVLTNVAQSAPLAGAWTDMGGRVIEWSQFLERFLPVSGTGRSIGPSFGSSARIGGVWTTNNDVALTWESATVLDKPPYLAAVVYDTFLLTGWEWSPTVEVGRAAEDELLAGSLDAVTPAGRTEYTVVVDPELSRSLVYAPVTPLRMSEPATVSLIDSGDWFAQLERPTSGDAYRVTSLIRATEEDGGPTEGKLRVAGDAYPEGMLERYGRAAIPPDAMTSPEAEALLEEIDAAGETNPYDIAKRIVMILQDPTRFRYDTDVRDLGCTASSIVDCFAIYRAGYCEYYATTMAILLRQFDIPTRIVEGFLPGEKLGPGARYLVRNSDSHAWVQVYFPGHGWIDFDPTGGSVAALAPLPSGRPEATPSGGPGASASRGPRPDPTLRGAEDLGPTGSVTGAGRGPGGPLIVVAVLLAVIMGSIALVVFRRGPRGPVTADGAYGMVTRFATRFGFGPRPNQTVYEYAGSLAEVLPDARPELEVVARAKVEVAYGGRRLGEDRLAALRDAQRRLRTSLLRLALRRDRRPKRR